MLYGMDDYNEFGNQRKLNIKKVIIVSIIFVLILFLIIYSIVNRIFKKHVQNMNNGEIKISTVNEEEKEKNKPPLNTIQEINDENDEKDNNKEDNNKEDNNKEKVQENENNLEKTISNKTIEMNMMEIIFKFQNMI